MQSHNKIPGVSFASIVIFAWVTGVILAVTARLVTPYAYPVYEPYVPPGGCLTIQEHRMYCDDTNIRLARTEPAGRSE
jgi:hypothetical protein